MNSLSNDRKSALHNDSFGYHKSKKKKNEKGDSFLFAFKFFFNHINFAQFRMRVCKIFCMIT